MDHDRYRKILADVGRRFAQETTNHTMTVLHDDGLYRHLRFRAPHNFTAFDLITWPGTLAIKGGYGAYMFSRETDMFGFFRTSNGVNVDYWAEKLPGGRDSVKVYDEDAQEELRRWLVVAYTEHGQRLADRTRAYEEATAGYQEALAVYQATPRLQRWPFQAGGVREPVQPVQPPTVADLRQQLAQARSDGDLNDEDGARRFLAGWEHAGVVSDAWERDLRVYDYHFVWSCHAIAWGIRRYDAAHPKTAPVQALASTGVF